MLVLIRWAVVNRGRAEHGTCLLRPILRRVRQWLLMFVDPSPIAHVDVATAQPEVLGFAQWRTGDLFAHAGAARSWLVDWHDRRHVDFSKNQAPDCSGADKVRAVSQRLYFLE
jgi:hypothetical protein